MLLSLPLVGFKAKLVACSGIPTAITIGKNAYHKHAEFRGK